MDDDGGEGGGPPPGIGNGAIPRGGGGVYKPQTSYSLSNKEPKTGKPNFRPLATNKQLEEYSSMYQLESYFDRYFTITAVNQRNLSEIDTIKANEELEGQIGGTPNNIKELRSGALLVEVRNKTQSDNITKLRKLAGCEVNVTSNDKLNQCKGTIYYRNAPKYTDDQIKAALNKSSNIPVQEVYRMNKRDGANLIELPIYLLTFQSTQLPSHVTIGWTRCSTRMYIPRPRRCFNCQAFGHGAKTCRNLNKICVQCAEICDGNHSNPCLATAKCSNCGENHPASYHHCQNYKKEQEVLNLQAHSQLTYSAAKRKVQLRTSTSANHQEQIPLSYAGAAQSPANRDKDNQEQPQSQIIKTKQTSFKNSTFLALERTSPSDVPSPGKDNRKRNLSDPAIHQIRKMPNTGNSPGPIPQNAPPYQPSSPNQHNKNKAAKGKNKNNTTRDQKQKQNK